MVGLTKVFFIFSCLVNAMCWDLKDVYKTITQNNLIEYLSFNQENINF